MIQKTRAPNFALRDLIGLACVLVLAAVLIMAAFLTHAGPFILIALMILLIFGLLRFYRERGRESESKEVVKALRTRLHKGEKLIAFTVGDRRRIKPLSSLVDFALLMFTQGLAAEGSGALAVDDTFVALTERRLIAIDRRKRPTGKKLSLRTRLNLERLDESKGKHAVLFEATREDLLLSAQLGVFYLARLKARAIDGRTFSIGLNSRYWATQAVILSEEIRNTDFETETIP